MLTPKTLLILIVLVFIMPQISSSQMTSNSLPLRFDKKYLVHMQLRINKADYNNFHHRFDNLQMASNDDCSYPGDDAELFLGIMSFMVAMGYYCFDTGDIGYGIAGSFLGSAGLLAPAACKLSINNNGIKDKRKLIWHWIGIPTAFTIGLYHSAASDPDDPLGGALICTGLLIADILGAKLFFK